MTTDTPIDLDVQTGIIPLPHVAYEDWEDPQTAMMLTETEWQDLAIIAKCYEADSRWIFYASPERLERPDHQEILRRRNLCERIIKACE